MATMVYLFYILKYILSVSVTENIKREKNNKRKQENCAVSEVIVHQLYVLLSLAAL